MPQGLRQFNFNPRSPCGERRNLHGFHFLLVQFQSTLPVRGATTNTSGLFVENIISIHAPRAGSDIVADKRFQVIKMISIHAPRAGSDSPAVGSALSYPTFQSTLPVRGATSAENTRVSQEQISIHAPRAGSDIFSISTQERSSISIHAPRAGSDRVSAESSRVATISIHAPRAGSDSVSTPGFDVCPYFNPRSPCGERRAATPRRRRLKIFQSTLPVRGATRLDGAAGRMGQNFNPRSPCGERPLMGITVANTPCISIHAPRAGSDPLMPSSSSASWVFQSTLPVRGATVGCCFRSCTSTHFNPRSPCGERRSWGSNSNPQYPFQSTLPVRGATGGPISTERSAEIFQSTLPVRGATVFGEGHNRDIDFNPRSPCGERLRRGRRILATPVISIHAPRAGSDCVGVKPVPHARRISIHAPRAGSDDV